MREEKRKHQRLSFEGTIFLELVAPGMAEDHSGEVVLCKTIDISRSGVRVGVDRELTVGAILQIGVELSQEENTLYLAGEVKWCRQSGDEATVWLVGFELLNASNSDIETWRALLTEMDSADSSSM